MSNITKVHWALIRFGSVKHECDDSFYFCRKRRAKGTGEEDATIINRFRQPYFVVFDNKHSFIEDSDRGKSINRTTEHLICNNIF